MSEENKESGGSPEMNVLDRLASRDGRVLAPQKLGHWSGLLGVDAPPLAGGDPLIRWDGAKLPMDLWLKLASFFRHASETWRSEASARLVYSAERDEWKAVVVPQWVATGMDSDELKGTDLTPERAALRQAAFDEAGPGFLSMGTIHSHHLGSAFQSGKDRVDELGQPGVHITFGRVTSDEIHVHGRASFRGVLYRIDWRDWFPGWPEGLDPEAPAFDFDVGAEFAPSFPAEWLDRCFVPPPPPPAEDRYRFWLGAGLGVWDPPGKAERPVRLRRAPRRRASVPANAALERAMRKIYSAVDSAPFALWAQDRLEDELKLDPESDLEDSAEGYVQMAEELLAAVDELLDCGAGAGLAHSLVDKAKDGRRAPPPVDARRRRSDDGEDAWSGLIERDGCGRGTMT